MSRKTVNKLAKEESKQADKREKAAKKASSLPEHAPDSVYKMLFKKGMKCILLSNNESTEAKRGDVVKVTTVTSTFKGVGSSGYYNDYEMLRVSNGKWTWRISRSELLPQ